MKFTTYTQFPKRKNHIDFGDFLTFPLATLSGQNFSLVYDQNNLQMCNAIPINLSYT